MNLNELAVMVPRTLFHIQGLGDSAINSKWVVVLPDIRIFKAQANELSKPADLSVDTSTLWGGDLGKSINKSINDALGNISELAQDIAEGSKSTTIAMRAIEISLNFPQVDTTNINLRARKMSLPTGESTSSFTMSFLESKDYDCLKYFELWKRCVFNPNTGFFGLPFNLKDPSKGYAQTLDVHVFDSSGLEEGVGHIYGCYPTQVDSYKFGPKYELMQTSVTFEMQSSEWEDTSGFLSTAIGMLSSARNITSMTTDKVKKLMTGNNAIGKGVKKVF